MDIPAGCPRRMQSWHHEGGTVGIPDPKNARRSKGGFPGSKVYGDQHSDHVYALGICSSPCRLDGGPNHLSKVFSAPTILR